VPLEFAPPKYAVIVNTIQARIEDGTYPPGLMLPSETQIMNEFGVSRPTVVRALEYLRQHGWIDTRPGKGRFARPRPVEPRALPPHAQALLGDEAVGRTRVVDAKQVPAPPRAASALDVDEGTPVMMRRRLIDVDEVGPVELGIAYVPLDVADGTEVGSMEPMPEGLLRHLTVRKRMEFVHATERISARQATSEEATLLELARRECVLTALLSIYDRTGRPAFALDLVIPPSRHELEDAFPITQ